jgi:transposase-like protein
MNWQQVFEDLRVRGVERTRFVATTEPTAAHLTLPGATVVPSVGQLLRHGLASVAPRDRRSAANVLSALRAAGSAQAARTALANLSASQWGKQYPAAVESWQASLLQLAPFFALAPRLRRIMLSADEAAQRMQGHLIRAVGRHGCFDDREAAVSFLEGKRLAVAS